MTRSALPIAPADTTEPVRRRRILSRLAESAAVATGGLGLLIACAACCTPVLVGLGVLTGAAATGLENVFLAVGATLMLTAGALLLLRWLRGQQSGQPGCSDDCAC